MKSWHHHLLKCYNCVCFVKVGSSLDGLIPNSKIINFTSIGQLYDNRYLFKYCCSVIALSLSYFLDSLIPPSYSSYILLKIQIHGIDSLLILNFWASVRITCLKYHYQMSFLIQDLLKCLQIGVLKRLILIHHAQYNDFVYEL